MDASQATNPSGERTLVGLRPSAWFILLRSGRRNAALVIAALASFWAVSRFGGGALDPSWVLWAWAGLLVPLLVYDALDWATRRYVLTDRRVLSARGVFSRAASDVPLDRVQDLALVRSLAERLLGLGSVGVSSAGGPIVDCWWRCIAEPGRAMEAIRSAMKAPPALRLAPSPGPGGSPGLARAGADATSVTATGPATGPAGTRARRPGRFLAIGLIGGVGSGKSTVASMLARKGLVVIDSDAQAKACLEEPEVKRELARWWGAGVIGPDGTVDRRAVADIVFADPAQRSRLEKLVHPLVARRRAEARERARASGAAGIVIDAPLLLEAGADRECDAVIFVDAPLEHRLARVGRRGWDGAELARREAAQLPLEEKRRRADAVVVNDAGLEALEARVSEAWDRLSSGAIGRGSSGAGKSPTDA